MFNIHLIASCVYQPGFPDELSAAGPQWSGSETEDEASIKWCIASPDCTLCTLCTVVPPPAYLWSGSLWFLLQVQLPAWSVILEPTYCPSSFPLVHLLALLESTHMSFSLSWGLYLSQPQLDSRASTHQEGAAPVCRAPRRPGRPALAPRPRARLVAMEQAARTMLVQPSASGDT